MEHSILISRLPRHQRQSLKIVIYVTGYVTTMILLKTIQDLYIILRDIICHFDTAWL